MRQLFLVRHAHRDTDGGRLKDNGLSEKGIRQAKQVSEFLLESVEFTKEITLISSPKLRCIETLRPFAKKIEREILTSSLLDEGSGFDQKVDEFLHEWKFNGSAVTVVCSHGDWLPVAAERALGFSFDFKKGAVCELREESGALALFQLIQSLHFLKK